MSNLVFKVLIVFEKMEARNTNVIFSGIKHYDICIVNFSDLIL